MPRRLRQELPPEIADDILVRLPVRVLCQLRLVCKSWNHMITQPEFVSRHAQAHRQAPPYILISPKVLSFDPGVMELFKDMLESCLHIPDSIAERAKRRDWKILDVAEKRFYTLSDFFIEDHLLQNEYCGWDKYTLAADGGLVYALYHGDTTLGLRHIVCNPVSKTWHQLPEPGFHCSYDHDVVVMSVDKATQSYKIVTIEAKNRVRSRPNEVYLYDSATTRWRMVCEVPAGHRAWSSIFLHGVFYTLLVDTGAVPWLPKLYSCDLETGEWSCIDAVLPSPSHLQDKLQLVVTLGRLFFVEYTGVPMFNPYGAYDDRLTDWEILAAFNNVKKKQLIKVSISEILLAEKEVMKLAEAHKYSKYLRRMLDRPQNVIGNPVVAVGCGNWIFISSLLGHILGFDLVRKCWEDQLPANTMNMYETNRQKTYECQGMYVGILDLDRRKLEELRVKEELRVPCLEDYSD